MNRKETREPPQKSYVDKCQGEHMEIFETNFFGPIKIANAFLPHFRERREGMLVFVGSRQAYRTSVPVSSIQAPVPSLTCV